MADSYITAGFWASHPNGSTTPSRLSSQLRSLTPTPKIAGMKQVTKSTSTPHLSKMAGLGATSPGPSALFRSESEMNTIPDPRTPSPGSIVSRNGSVDSTQHPDLSNEVAMLSTKLINAINYQTNLDDSLQQTRHQLEAANKRLAELDTAAKKHAEMMARGLLIEKELYDKMETQLRTELAEERRRRVEAEKKRREMDGEVEALTASLFEEANKMVENARQDTEVAEKRSEQLKQQLSDTEMLLTSQQEQLQDLKTVMQSMNSDRDDNTHPSTAPSTPGMVPQDKLNRMFEPADFSPNTPGFEDITPEHPLKLSHLIHPIMRTDLTAYKEFQEMLKVSRTSAPPSRVGSGNYGALNVMGLGSLTKNNSTTSLPSIKGSPSSIGGNSPRDPPPTANLKDEKFYKRVLSEDIEPTLRLDIAPGLSWMARRTVLSNITAGNVVVEPHPPIPKFRGPVFPCALCNEARKGEEYSRKHRFRPSETDDASYPLCDYCLGRLRATCDFISFLRMVAGGHWRAETDEDRKSAWEECVRLRERMFWTRLGGGVVPAVIPIVRDSPRSPTFSRPSADKLELKSEESLATGENVDSAVDMSEPPVIKSKKEGEQQDPFKSDKKDPEKRVSIGKTILHPPSKASEAAVKAEEKEGAVDEAEAQIRKEAIESVQSTPTTFFDSASEDTRTDITSPMHETPNEEKEQRLSFTIPGSFE